MKSIFLIHLPETTVFSDHDIIDIGYLYCHKALWDSVLRRLIPMKNRNREKVGRCIMLSSGDLQMKNLSGGNC